MGAQQPADHADVRLEHRHVDVGLEVRSRADQLGDAAKFGEVAHDRERVQGVDQGQGEAAPRVEAVAAQRAQLVVRIGVRQVAGVGVIEHGPYLLAQADQIPSAVLPESADQDQEAEDRARSEEDHRCDFACDRHRLRVRLSVITVHSSAASSVDVMRCVGSSLDARLERPALAT